jgi:hypothetical protein
MSSFMTAMHPTDEYCASRGMTLDANIKQCVVPPPAQGADATGSLPSPSKPVEQAPLPSPQQTPAQPAAQPPRTQPAPLQPAAQQPRPQPAPLQQPLVEVPQPPAQEKRTGVLIEPEAMIKPDSQIADMATEFAHFARASGYRCDSVSSLTQHAAKFTLTCNRSSFRYAINKDNDGRWIVTVE